MIIRRKHTANFTTIGNALFNDERLEADEVGVLAYLLSRPNDWQVRRTQLAKRFRLGRDSIRRIMRSAIRFGWVVSRVTRLSNGTISVVYEVRDEPGPELSEDEARAALSLVSSGAAPGEASNDDGPEDGTEGTQTEGADPPIAVYGQPLTGQPEAAGRLLESPPGPSKSLLKTESQRTDSPNGVRAFSEVQAAWPSDHIASTFACEKLHAELTEVMQAAALDGVRPYLDDCHAQTRKVCDLGTYYRERRWERFQKTKSSTEIAIIKPHTPEFHRWCEYRSAVGDHEGLRAMDVMVKLGRDITVPSRWPPAIQGRGSTDPPKESSAA